MYLSVDFMLINNGFTRASFNISEPTYSLFAVYVLLYLHFPFKLLYCTVVCSVVVSYYTEVRF